MPKFRKKPVEVEAVQINTEQDARDTPGICTGGPDCSSNAPEDVWPHVHTLEVKNGHSWTPGDWLITGVQGERYFCKPDIFEMTYESVPETEDIFEQTAGSSAK